MRGGVTAEGLPHAILTAQACCGVAVAGPPPVSHPQCGSPNGCHATWPRANTRGACCARHTGSGTGLPRGVGRRYEPAHVWQPLPGGASRLRLVAAARHPARYGRRRSFAATAFYRPAHRPPRRRLLACRSRSPPLSRPRCGSRRHACRAPATEPGAGGGSRAAVARPLRVDTRPSPHARRHCRLPPLRAKTSINVCYRGG